MLGRHLAEGKKSSCASASHFEGTYAFDPAAPRQIMQATSGNILDRIDEPGALMDCRPTIGTFERWASDVQDDFWLWDSVLPSYQRSCNFTPPDFSKIDTSINVTYDAAAFSPEGGPLHVSYGNYLGPFNRELAQGFEALGFDHIPGVNSGRMIGYGVTTSTVNPEFGTRDSSETSFLQYAASNTDNIKIYPNTVARRIIFDDGRRATGVEVTVNNAFSQFNYTLHANNEVILSAGTVREL